MRKKMIKRYSHQSTSGANTIGVISTSKARYLSMVAFIKNIFSRHKKTRKISSELTNEKASLTTKVELPASPSHSSSTDSLTKEVSSLSLSSSPVPHSQGLNKTGSNNISRTSTSSSLFLRRSSSSLKCTEQRTHNKIIGKGTTGDVEVYFNPRTQVKYAVKKFRSNTPSNSYNQELRNILSKEYQVLDRINRVGHRNIVKVIELHNKTNSLVMEYVPFSLYRIMTLSLTPSTEERKSYFKQICLAIQFLHGEGIVHRDLKLENIMVDYEGCVKIIDFGSAVILGSQDAKCHGMGGSEPLMAPEVLAQLSYEGLPVDIWSLGILMYQMFNNSQKPRFPWKTAKPKGDPEFDEYINDQSLFLQSTLDQGSELLLQLLAINPKSRISIGNVMEYQFISEISVSDTKCHERTLRLCNRFWGDR